jgi:hypothetical protein
VAGNPNQGQPVDVEWPNIQESPLAEMFFSTDGDSVELAYRENYCNVWDKWGYTF